MVQDFQHYQDCVMFLPLRYVLALLSSCGRRGLRASESTEPPPPRAAPRGIVSAEMRPRAGGVIAFGGDPRRWARGVKELLKPGEKVSVVAPAAPIPRR